MTRHTPTPWVAAPTGKTMQGYSQPFGILEHGKPNLVAGVFGDVAGSAEVAKANAAFIVHACNTHEQLVAALENLVKYGDTPHTECTNPQPYIQARAALAAAKKEVSA